MVADLTSQVLAQQIEPDAEGAHKRDVYGSFLLGDMEFAVSVNAIQEVVNQPCEYSKMPLSPPYLLGLFSLRGMVVPVVDLRCIFQNRSSEKKDHQKIAIIEYQEYCIGLLIDATCEVFHGNENGRSNFNAADNIRQQIIEGVFKFDNGERIIMILDPYALLQIDNVPQSENNMVIRRTNKNFSKRRQCISFFVGDSLCAVAIEVLQEIVYIKDIENTALSSGLCVGAINLRGTMVPVIDFSELLGLGASVVQEERHIEGYQVMIVKLQGSLFGLIIDAVNSIIAYFDDELVKFPTLAVNQHQLFQGCIVRDEAIDTILLDCKEILASVDIDSIHKINQTLYPAQTQPNLGMQDEKHSNDKKTFISFKIEDSYAIDIKEVKEVMDFPDNLIRPPDLPASFTGLFQLRGDLVAVIDSRLLYGAVSDSSGLSLYDKKILIFLAEDHQYALVVDSVESIISLNSQHIMALPMSASSPFKNKKDTIGEHVHEVIRVTCDQGAELTLQILKIESIVNKIKSSL